MWREGPDRGELGPLPTLLLLLSPGTLELHLGCLLAGMDFVVEPNVDVLQYFSYDIVPECMVWILDGLPGLWTICH